MSVLHFLVYTESEIKNIYKIKSLLKSELKTWDESFYDIMASKGSEKKQSNQVFFENDYKLSFSYLTGYIDYKFIQNAFSNMTPYFHMYTSNDEIKIKVYNPNNPINLSRCLDIFTNFGITIYIQKVYKMHAENEVCFIHDFSMEQNIKNIKRYYVYRKNIFILSGKVLLKTIPSINLFFQLKQMWVVFFYYMRMPII